MEDCHICAEQEGRVPVVGGAIYEDDLVYANHIYDDSAPTYLGYVMAETKRHAPGFADLTDSEAQALGLLVKRLSLALKACIGAEHIYSFVFGDHVSHIHVHVAGRYPGAPREYWGTRVDEWPDAPHGGEAEVEQLCARLRDYMNQFTPAAPQT